MRNRSNHPILTSTDSPDRNSQATKGTNPVFELMKRRRADEGGFTLIELLIVIIILGILAAIVVFAIGNTRKDSVTNSCKTDAKAIQLSLEAQKTTGGAYPTQAADIVAPANALQAGSSPLGALLKTWPGDNTTIAAKALGTATGDYRFAYASTDGKTYTVKVDGAHVDGAWNGTTAFTDTTDNAATACHSS
jgi:prepilin-type N-terminal cleavage/methylation domain-containing protein